MNIIAISAVTAGGKTTVTKALQKRLPKAAALYFDDYTFEGEVEDYGKWISEGADVNVWDLTPLRADIERIIRSGAYDFLLLDYPFAYEHRMINAYLNCCIFIDTPLDIAMARRVLRDMQDASADAIREEMQTYLNIARTAYVHMVNSQRTGSDHVIDGAMPLNEVIREAEAVILHC